MKESSSRPNWLSAFNAAALLLAFLFVANVCSAQDDEDPTQTAIALFNQGQDAHEKGELPEAIKSYEKAIALVPEFPEAELQMGNAFLSMGRLDEAERFFRKAVEHREDWSLALANLGSVLVSRRKYAEAEPILTKAISLDEQNFPAYSALTELRLNTKARPGVPKELLVKITALTAKAKPTASIWAARAGLESALGDAKAAKASVAKALELDPKNISARMIATSLALNEGDTTSAVQNVKFLEASVQASSPAVKILKARVLLADGKTGDAIALLDTVADSPEAATLRESIILNGSTSTAELEAQLAKGPKNSLVLSKLCSMFRLGDPAKALNYCRQASEAEPQNINHAIGYGAALVQAKSHLEAVNLFRRLLEVAPDNFTARANLATALFQLKRFPEAKAEYQWLVKKQPDLAVAYYFLAIAHDQLTEYLDAMANYQQFLRLVDKEKNKLEIEKVNLRLPGLQKMIKDGKGKKPR